MERWVHVYSEHNTLCYDKSIMWWYNNVEKNNYTTMYKEAWEIQLELQSVKLKQFDQWNQKDQSHNRYQCWITNFPKSLNC